MQCDAREMKNGRLILSGSNYISIYLFLLLISLHLSVQLSPFVTWVAYVPSKYFIVKFKSFSKLSMFCVMIFEILFFFFFLLTGPPIPSHEKSHFVLSHYFMGLAQLDLKNPMRLASTKPTSYHYCGHSYARSNKVKHRHRMGQNSLVNVTCFPILFHSYTSKM